MTSRVPALARRLLIALLAAAGAAGMLVLAPDAGSAATRAPSLSRSAGIAGEPVRVTGAVAAKKARPVQLQLGRSGRWSTVARGATTARGAYAFSIRVPARTSAVRVYAPKAKYTVKKKRKKRKQSMPAVTTAARAIVTQVQRGTTTSAGAPLYQAVNASTAPGRRAIPVESTFVPARPGRVVALQKLVGRVWKPAGVAYARENARGTAMFFLRPDSSGTFRAVAAASGGASAVNGYPATIKAWNEKFADEFGAKTYSNNWTTRNPGNAGGLARNRSYSAPQPGQVVLGGGAAALSAKPVTCGTAGTKAARDYPGRRCFANAQIQSNRSFTHGVLAARVKFQSRGGIHGGVWTSINTPEAVGKGKEIDFAEYFGDRRTSGGIGQFIHGGTAAKPLRYGGERNLNHLLPAGGQWSRQYHVYSVEWTSSRYVFRVDGRVVLTVTGAPSKEPQRLILSLLSSDDEARSLSTSGLAADPMKVDWVRVWQ